MARNPLPKVSEYVKNVAKSTAFAAVDTVRNQVPGITAFTESNREIIKKVYSDARDFRKSSRNADKMIKNSSVYKAVETGIDSMKDAITTGNFRGSDKSDDAMMKAMGWDLDFDMDLELTSDADDGDNRKAPSAVSRLGSAIYESGVTQGTAIAKGTDLVIRGNKASTKLIMSSMNTMNASINASLGSVYSEVYKTNKFLNGNLVNHMNNSKKYYEESLKIMRENSAMLKEVVEMQRNLYKASAASYSGNAMQKNIRNIYGVNNLLDIQEYKKLVKKNFANSTIGSFFDLTNMAGENTLQLLAAQLPSIIMSGILDAAMPNKLKKSLNSLDKSFSNIGATLLSRLSRNNSIGGLGYFLQEIFGIDLKEKKTLNTGKYNKGPIAFDGETKKSIVEVIPGYLARIEAALSGGEERYYDYASGTFKSISTISRDFDQRRANYVNRANRDIYNDFMSNDKRAKSGRMSKKERDEYDKVLSALMNYSYENIGDLDGLYGNNIKKIADSLGVPVSRLKRIRRFINKDTIAELAYNNQRARADYNAILEAEEVNGSINNVLFNGSHGEGGRRASIAARSGGGLLSLSKDEYGHNVFHYLREILAAIPSGGRRISSGSSIPRGRVRARRSKGQSSSSGSSSSSSNDGDDDPELGAFRGSLEELDREEAEANEQAAKRKELEDTLSQTSVGKFLTKAVKNVAGLLTHPFDYATRLIDKANNSIINLVFGDHALTKRDGSKANNVLDYIMDKIDGAFKDLKEKIVNSDFWKNYIDPIGGMMKEGAMKAWGRTKGAFNNTLGSAFRRIFGVVNNGGVVDAEDVANATETARGARLITKRGLTMISPGEMIIPASFDKKEQNRMLNAEKREKRKIFNAIDNNAAGTIKEMHALDYIKLIDDIARSNKGKFNENAAMGGLGAGAGLLVGNPILGAILGSTASILSHSESFKQIVFGKEEVDADGNKSRQGGVVPKKILDFFKKKGDALLDGGIVGGVLGLFTPFGVLGGAAIGAGLNYLSTSDSFKKFVFGDSETGKDGLIDKKKFDLFTGKIKEAAPNIAVGAGIGAIVGLTGPFGLVGGTALGAGLGLLSTTDQFHKFMFGDGEDDEGVAGAFKRGVVDPLKVKTAEFLENFKNFATEHIFNPLKNFWEPFSNGIKNSVNGAIENIKDHMNDMFEKTIGIPIHDFLQEKLFKPLTNTIGKLVKIPLNLLKGAIMLPTHALQGIGNTIRMGQIQRGTANYMSARERLAFRDKHSIRAAMGIASGRDRTLELDAMLNGMSEDQLRNLQSAMNGSLNDEKTLQQSIGNARTKLGKAVSKFFNQPNGRGGNLYDVVGGIGNVEALLNTIYDGGDYTSMVNNMNLDAGSKKKLLGIIENNMKDIQTAQAALDNRRSGTLGLNDEISKLFKDKKIKTDSRSARRKLSRLADAELNARYRQEELDHKEPEVAAVDNLTTLYDERTNSVLAKIDEIISTLKGEDTSSNKTKTAGAAASAIAAKADEDSKTATENRKKEEESEQREEEETEAAKKTTTFLEDIKNGLFGKANDKKKKGLFGEGGFLTSLSGGFGNLLKFLGVGGKVALGVGAVSLFGHGTEWFKNHIWPTIKKTLFGTTNEDGTKTDGIFGKFGTKLHDFFLGQDGKSGIFARITKWIDTKIITPVSNWISEKGGFSGLLAGAAGFVIEGLGHTITNVVAPVTAVLIKNLPSLIIGLGKGIIEGLKMVVNKNYVPSTRGMSFNTSESLSEIKDIANNATSDNPLKESMKKISNALFNVKETAAASAAYTTNKAEDFSEAFNNFGKFNDNRHDVTDSFGSSHSTNTVDFDENGNVITNYTKFNTTDSATTKLVKAGGRAFWNGLTGITKAATKNGGKLFAKGIGRGGTKLVTGAMGTAINVTKKGLTAAQSAGAAASTGLSRFLTNAQAAGALAKEGGISVGKVLAETSVNNNGIVGKITNAISNVFSKLFSGKVGEFLLKALKPGLPAKALSSAIEKLCAKLGNTLASKAVGAVGNTIVSAISNYSILGIATLVVDFIWGYDNADTIFGVAKGDTYTLSFGQKVLAGIVNMLTQKFTFGLIPASTIMDIAIEFLAPLFGIDTTSLNEARNNAEAIMDEWNKAHGADEQFDNLEDFNNKDKWTYKAGKAVKKFASDTWNNAKSAVSTWWNGDENGNGGVKQAIANSYNFVKGKVTSAVSQATNASTYSNAFKNIWESVKKTFTGSISPFSKEYWSNNNPSDDGNPLNTVGSVLTYGVKYMTLPIATVGYGVGSVIKWFKNIINDIKTGSDEAQKHIDAATAGEYSPFSKEYWQDSTVDSDNPMGLLSSVSSYFRKSYGLAPAFIGYIGHKISDGFNNMVKTVIGKDSYEEDQKVFDKAEKGEISILSKDYWKLSDNLKDNPLGLIGTVTSFINRLVNAPIIAVKKIMGSIQEKLNSVKDFFTGIGENIANFFGFNTDSVKKDLSNIKGKTKSAGRSRHIYQNDPRLANMKYGDSTIGQAGCAPVAATNLLNRYYGLGSVANAARYAESHGMTVPGGGTDITYFNSYLGSNGIPTRTTGNAGTVENALRNGNPVVMLGNDGVNYPGAPFGSNPHYVTAYGMDNRGNIIAEDPDLPNNLVAYNKNAMLSSMNRAVIAGKHRRGSGRRYGRARVSTELMSGNNYGYNNANYLTGKNVVNVALSQVGIEERAVNRVKYNSAYYGNDAGGKDLAWCCAFVWWVFHQAGAGKLFYGGNKTASCSELMRYMKSQGQEVATPAAGDIIFFKSGNSSYPATHVGIVVGTTSDGRIITVEGNTDYSGSDNGGCVMAKARSTKNVVAVCRPAYPYSYDSSSVISMSRWGDNTDYRNIALYGGQCDKDNSSLRNPDIVSDAQKVAGTAGNFGVTIGNNTNNISGTAETSSSGTIFDLIANAGKDLIKGIFGENVYNAFFGGDSINESNYSYTSSNSTSTQSTASGTSSDRQKIWNYLRSKGYSKEAAAGIMGNLKAESAYKSNNLEGQYERKFNMSDQEYTTAVDKGTRNRNTFINDKAGYGLAQWTYSTRKDKLYSNTVSRGKSISDIGAQLDTLYQELTSYGFTPEKLNKMNRDKVSDTILYDFEKPSNPTAKVNTRRGYSKEAYDEFYGLGRSGYSGSARATFNTRRSGNYGNAARSIAYSGSARPVYYGGAGTVDYTAFLNSIVSVLATIASNTAILDKILNLLADNLNIKIDRADIEQAATKSKAETERNLRELIQRTTGNNVGVSKLLNNKDTEYIVNAMYALASE